jgi:hypothetical protein
MKKKLVFCCILKVLKIEGSGSISLRHGSADPDPNPHQNVMDPFRTKVQLFYTQITEQSGGGREDRRGVPPLCFALLDDGHLVRGPH